MRTQIISFLALAILVASTQGAEDITPRAVGVGDTLSITGPSDPVKVSEGAWLKIEGLTLEEIKQAKKANLFDLTVFPLDDVRVHASYDWLNDNLELSFKAKKPGKYLVKMHLVRNGKLERAATVVKVGGDVPPDPIDPPDPTDGPRQVLFIVESSELPSLTRPQQGILSSLTLRKELAKAGHVLLGIHDKDSSGVDGVPDHLKKWFEAAGGKKLPCLLIAPKDGGTIVSHPMPADEEGFWGLIGGKP